MLIITKFRDVLINLDNVYEIFIEYHMEMSSICVKFSDGKCAYLGNYSHKMAENIIKRIFDDYICGRRGFSMPEEDYAEC